MQVTTQDTGARHPAVIRELVLDLQLLFDSVHVTQESLSGFLETVTTVL